MYSGHNVDAQYRSYTVAGVPKMKKRDFFSQQRDASEGLSRKLCRLYAALLAGNSTRWCRHES